MKGIVVKNVCRDIGEPPVRIISDVSFTVRDGEFISLTGKSGSGKSTLLYLLSSLDNPTSGTVEYNGVATSAMENSELHRFRNRDIGFVFQFHHLVPEITVLENILLPARKAELYEERKGHALELLDRFEIGKLADRYPSNLSGGEQQRVAIARALIMDPLYMFADEPTGNLDSANSRIIMEIFRDINKNLKTTIIMVTHDPDFAAIAPRQIMLKDGCIMSDTIRGKKTVKKRI